MPKFTVDGQEIEVPNGATVLQACEPAGKQILRFRHRAPQCFAEAAR